MDKRPGAATSNVAESDVYTPSAPADSSANDDEPVGGMMGGSELDCAAAEVDTKDIRSCDTAIQPVGGTLSLVPPQLWKPQFFVGAGDTEIEAVGELVVVARGDGSAAAASTAAAIAQTTANSTIFTRGGRRGEAGRDNCG